MAGGAGYAVFVMGRTHELALLEIGLVTGQATPGDSFRPCVCVDKYFGLIAASRNMGRAGSVARLAAMDLFAPDFGQVGSIMRARIDVLELIFMAGLAHIGAHVGRAAGWVGKVRRGRRFGRGALSPGANRAAPQDYPRECRKPSELIFHPAAKDSHRIKSRL
jgi:hypothetical protein